MIAEQTKAEADTPTGYCAFLKDRRPLHPHDGDFPPLPVLGWYGPRLVFLSGRDEDAVVGFVWEDGERAWRPWHRSTGPLLSVWVFDVEHDYLPDGCQPPPDHAAWWARTLGKPETDLVSLAGSFGFGNLPLLVWWNGEPVIVEHRGGETGYSGCRWDGSSWTYWRSHYMTKVRPWGPHDRLPPGCEMPEGHKLLLPWTARSVTPRLAFKGNELHVIVGTARTHEWFRTFLWDGVHHKWVSDEAPWTLFQRGPTTGLPEDVKPLVGYERLFEAVTNVKKTEETALPDTTLEKVDELIRGRGRPYLAYITLPASGIENLCVVEKLFNVDGIYHGFRWLTRESRWTNESWTKSYCARLFNPQEDVLPDGCTQPRTLFPIVNWPTVAASRRPAVAASRRPAVEDAGAVKLPALVVLRAPTHKDVGRLHLLQTRCDVTGVVRGVVWGLDDWKPTLLDPMHKVEPVVPGSGFVEVSASVRVPKGYEKLFEAPRPNVRLTAEVEDCPHDPTQTHANIFAKGVRTQQGASFDLFLLVDQAFVVARARRSNDASEKVVGWERTWTHDEFLRELSGGPATR